MLSIVESAFIFQFIRFCSSSYILPFVIDTKSGKLQSFSDRKHLIWVFLYSIAILHYLHGLTQFILLLTVRQDQIVLFHLPPQFDVLLLPMVFHPIVFITFHFQRDILVKVFNELYDPKVGNNARRPLGKLSLQELLALASGIMLVGCVISYVLMMILMNDMAHLLINNPYVKPLRSWLVAVVISTLVETCSVAIWAVNVGFLLQLNCLVLSKMESMGKSILANLRYAYKMLVHHSTHNFHRML